MIKIAKRQFLVDMIDEEKEILLRRTKTKKRVEKEVTNLKMTPETQLKELTTLSDIPCKHCGSSNTYVSNTDEQEFGHDGTGHMYRDMVCEDCKTRFRTCFKFNYEITEAWYR